ncbi:MAG: YtxH domain-containing protein [Chloroflexota bacterium]|nr:YtxH domain-containing protein [Chloroflexota bacterium]
MFSRVRIAIRFFFFGLAVGILLAPRSGVETRRMVREKADRILNDVLDAATLGTYESGEGSAATDAPATGTTARATRGGNGSRSRATKSSSTAASEAGV